MSFVGTGGVAKLSQLTIDVDKDWNGKAITNLKGLAAGLLQGDLIIKGPGGVLIALHPGVANTVLTSSGPGALPTWAPGGTIFNRYIPETVSSSKSSSKVTIAKTVTKTGSLVDIYVDAIDDQPGSYLKRYLLPISSSKSVTTKASADKSVTKTPIPSRWYDLQIVVQGAMADDGGVQTNETTAVQNATANDMTLLPTVPELNDAYYFGHDYIWDYLTLNIGTSGAGVWTITWEYWNGSWTALSGVTDNTVGFKGTTGNKTVTFTRPGDWTTTAVNAITKYWIRGRVSAYTSVITQPKGTQAWATIIT